MIIQELVFFYINFIRKNIKNFSPNISNNKKKGVNKITNKMIKTTNKKMEWKNNNMMNNNMTKWTRIKLIINISMMKIMIMKCKIDYLYINLIIYIKIIFFYFFMSLNFFYYINNNY